MANRVIDLHLRGKNINGEVRFLTPQLMREWAAHFPDENWTCTFKLVSGMKEKQRLFAYLHGPLLSTCLSHFEDTGQYPHLTTDAMYKDFKGMFSTFPRYNTLTGKEETAIYDYSEDGVHVSLLKKLVDDIIAYMSDVFPHIEGVDRSGFIAPDPEVYRVEKKLGKGFSPVKGKKFTDV